MSNETKLINNYINDFYDTLQQTIPQTHIIKKIINTLKLYSNKKKITLLRSFNSHLQ